MALSDYFSGVPVRSSDKESEDFLKAASAYAGNRNVLEAIGAPDTQKKASEGFLSKTFNVLGVPGRLVRAGLFEALGTPTPDLQAVSGMDQFRKLLSGEVRAGFGELPMLKTQEWDSFPTKALKLGAAFTGDVATDPISYISAPGALSRKAAATILLKEGERLVPELLAVNKGYASKKLSELVANAPTSRIAKIQEELGVTGAGTPADLLTQPGVLERIQSDEVGNYLAEGLIKGGRREVIKRLTDLTGSKDAAFALFKKLPEDVRGGVVVAGLLGKPLKKADGSYVRLTEGTGESLGKFGDVVNRARLATSTVFNPIVSHMGKAGQVLAGTRRALNRGDEDVLGRDRFIDYVTTKNALGYKQSDYVNLSNDALAVANVVANERARYTGADLERFDTMFEEFFHKPSSVKQPADTLESKAAQGAQKLVEKIMNMRQVAVDEGIDIGDIGAEGSYRPLVMTEDSVERVRKTDRRLVASGEYSSVFGRDSYIKALADPEMRARAGFEDPNNPGVVYFDAKEVNKLMEERGDFRRFETDPLKIFGKYANDLASRIANRRFLKSLEASGTLIRDVPGIRTLLAERDAATYVAALTNVSPEIRAEAQKLAESAARRLATIVDYPKRAEAQQKITAIRDRIKAEFDSANAQLETANTALRDANAAVRILEPRVAPITRRLQELRRNFIENNEQLTERERAARNIRARLFTAEVNDIIGKGDYRNLLRRLRYGRERAVAPEEIALYDELIASAKVDREDAMAQLDSIANQADLVEQELAFARQERNALTQQEAQTQVTASTEFIGALERKAAAEKAVLDARAARQEATKAWRNAEADIAFESKDNIDALVSNYAEKSLAARRLEKETSERLAELRRANTPKEQYDQIKAQADEAVKQAFREASAAKDIVKESLSYTSKRFEGVAKEYADELFKAVDELTTEQFQSLRVLSSERKIQELIQTYEAGGRDETVTMQAIGDLVRVYNSIADKISPETISKLGDLQKNILNKSTVASLLREEKVGSKLADEITGKFNYDPIAVGRSTQDLYASQGIQKTLADMYRRSADPTEWDKVIRDYIDPLLMLWKSAITVGRGPGYVATNTIGGMYMNWLGNVSARNTKLAAKALLDINAELKAVQTANPEMSLSAALQEAERRSAKKLGNVKIVDTDLYSVINEFFNRGAFFDTETEFALRTLAQAGSAAPLETYRLRGGVQREFLTEAKTPLEEQYRRGINFLTTNRVQRSLNNMAQNSELFLRLSAFIDGYEKYGNFDSALANVHLLHFNYQDLSNAEQWVRRFVPFYTWTRNNVPAQLRAMAMQPGKIQRALYANEEFQRQFGAEGDESWMNQVLPEYINVSDGFATSFKFGNNNIGYYLRLPFEDINKLFQVKSGFVLPRPRELANMLGLFTTPIEIAAGVDLGTGAPFSERGAAVPSYYNLLKWIPGSGIYTDVEGQTRASGGFAKAVQDFLPALGTAERAVTGLSAIPLAAGVDIPESIISKSQQEKALTDLLNISGLAALAGGSVTTLTPRQFSGEIRRRTDIQRADIGRLAASGNYDTDWIREQLRNGRTPEQIAILLASGYGQTKENAVERSTMTEKARKQYIESLQGL